MVIEDSKILIVDGSNMIHRQLCQPNMWELEYNGVKTGGVFGFLRSLQTSLSRFQDYYPVVVFDYGRSPRRLSIYPNYKHQQDQDEERAAKRKALESGAITFEESQDEYLNELIRQSNIIKDLLRLFKIPVVQVHKWEGDDIMAILSRISRKSVVVTDDKDMYQLLTDNCSIFRPMRYDSDGNKGELVLFDDYKSKVYNNVRHLTIIKSIIGDASDNIPKVAKGLGYKAAESIADIIMSNDEDEDYYLKSLESMGGKYKKFVDNHEQFRINMKLVDLSLVETDPYIVNLIHDSVSIVDDKSVPNMIDIMKILSSNGITKFDFSRMISSINLARSHMYE